jgi:hypothetical protein
LVPRFQNFKIDHTSVRNSDMCVWSENSSMNTTYREGHELKSMRSRYVLRHIDKLRYFSLCASHIYIKIVGCSFQIKADCFGLMQLQSIGTKHCISNRRQYELKSNEQACLCKDWTYNFYARVYHVIRSRTRTHNGLLLLHLQTELFYYYKQFSIQIILPLLCVCIHVYWWLYMCKTMLFWLYKRIYQRLAWGREQITSIR